MRIGVTFPQSDLPLDVGEVREWVAAVEDAGFEHILVYDHVLGADRSTRPGWDGFHDSGDRFHEILVLMGFLAAVTTRVELVSGVLCLPQRQTALVAKQAAEIDHLSGGRLRLGVGIGWNAVEFEALGQGFGDRAARFEEQITLLRSLWSNPIIDVEGRWHRIRAAGLNPLPTRPIPIWIGSRIDRTIDRVARLADGWMPENREPDVLAPQLDLLAARLAAHGRDRSEVGLHGRLSLKDGDPGYWRKVRDFWAGAGAEHLSVSTIWSGETTLAGHLELTMRYRDEIGLS